MGGLIKGAQQSRRLNLFCVYLLVFRFFFLLLCAGFKVCFVLLFPSSFHCKCFGGGRETEMHAAARGGLRRARPSEPTSGLDSRLQGSAEMGLHGFHRHSCPIISELRI